jgi:hypothetical protein
LATFADPFRIVLNIRHPPSFPEGSLS